MTTQRLFVAIDLPGTIRHFLQQLDPQLPGMRWAHARQMHLTLGFFGDVPGETEAHLQEKLSAIRFSPFVLPVQAMGAFPPKGPPKIVWIGVGAGHPHLFQVHKRVQEAALAAHLEPDLRPWHPHITLARCRDVSPAAARKFLVQNSELDAGMFRVEEFSLYSSQLTSTGSLYTRELSIPCR